MMSWLSVIGIQGIRPLVLAVLAASFVGLQLPELGSMRSETEAASSEQIPPGQLKRKAFSGSVVAKSSTSITVSTQHGNVKANVTASTVISAGSEKNLTMADILVGSRVAVKLNASPFAPPPVVVPTGTTSSEGTPGAGTNGTSSPPTPEPTLVPTATPTTTTGSAVIESSANTIHGLAQVAAQGTTTPTSTPEPPTPTATSSAATPTATATSSADTPTATATSSTPTPESGDGGQTALPTIREVTALRIHLKQADALVKHKRAVGKCKTKGKFKVIDEDGEVSELDDETGNGTTSASLIPGSIARIESTLLAMIGGGGAIGSGSVAFRGILLQETSTNGTSTSAGSDGDACEGSGEDLILLLRQKGKSTSTIALRATLQSQRIDDRLARHKARLEAKGDIEAVAKVTARADRQKERVELRLEKTLARADAKDKTDIQRAVNKRKGPKASTGGDGDGVGATATPKPKGKAGPTRTPRPKKKDTSSSSGGGSSGGGGGGKPTPKPKKN